MKYFDFMYAIAYLIWNIGYTTAKNIYDEKHSLTPGNGESVCDYTIQAYVCEVPKTS